MTVLTAAAELRADATQRVAPTDPRPELPEAPLAMPEQDVAPHRMTGLGRRLRLWLHPAERL